MRKIRCAIYTRKSSEEGLEQGFNSLDAQREACAAYVLSQASEGWSLIADHYDDGGVSGGTLERPALQRLLADVAADMIDIIVVYKVDRLTRSLLDFSKLVEAFDAANVSFVSITQSFNTTTSMGRLTLNMLLSFAQFEREVTAERIRDKIAASKAKGMWMGGTPPLGYRPNGRSLVIVEEHARIIRDIYDRYLELGNVRLVTEQLARQGIYAPARVSVAGRSFGGRPLTRGQLYAILKNPIYVGDVAHHGQIHEGQHAAIIDRALWNQVQERLASHVRGEHRAIERTASLLAGKIVDQAGEALVATHACKGKVRYRYYVSRALQHGHDPATDGLRVPAREIEGLVAEQVAAFFDDPIALMTRASVAMTPRTIAAITERCTSIAAELRRQRTHPGLRGLVHQVRVLPDRVEIDLSIDQIAGRLEVRSAEGARLLTIISEARLTRTGRVVRLVKSDGTAPAASVPDSTLVKLLLKAHRWWNILAKGELNMDELARQEGVTSSYLTRIVRLAFLAPEVVDALLQGRPRVGIDGAALTSTGGLPTFWSEQKVRCLPSSTLDREPPQA
jgi:site-specific DNA recombinase